MMLDVMDTEVVQHPVVRDGCTQIRSAGVHRRSDPGLEKDKPDVFEIFSAFLLRLVAYFN